MSTSTPVSLFDGHTLNGWTSIPRVYGTWAPGGGTIAQVMADQGLTLPDHPERHPAKWEVEDGTIVGRQDPPGCGYGGYLITNREYGDFDLQLDVKLDWPADSGVMIRRRFHSWEGFQVLLDHRREGGVGGFFGNGLASFSAVPFTIDAGIDANRNAIGLVAADPGVGQGTRIAHRRALLSYAADVADFLTAWHWADWNHVRIRCHGNSLA